MGNGAALTFALSCKGFVVVSFVEVTPDFVRFSARTAALALRGSRARLQPHRGRSRDLRVHPRTGYGRVKDTCPLERVYEFWERVSRPKTWAFFSPSHAARSDPLTPGRALVRLKKAHKTLASWNERGERAQILPLHPREFVLPHLGPLILVLRVTKSPWFDEFQPYGCYG